MKAILGDEIVRHIVREFKERKAVASYTEGN
jgi:hypothetical protein